MLLNLIFTFFSFSLAFSSPNLGGGDVEDSLKNYVLLLHEKYIQKIEDLQNKFEQKLRIQDERIISLRHDLSEKTDLIHRLTKKYDYVRQEVDDLKAHIMINAVNQPDIAVNRTSRGNRISTSSFKEKFQKIRQERLLLQDNTIQTKNVIAFYAYLSTNLPAAQAVENHVLVFDIVRTNIGGAYHPHTGVFIVPESGAYVFTWSLPHGYRHQSLHLLVNSEVWGSIYVHMESQTEYVESTGVAVVQANAGDDVYVRLGYSSTKGGIMSNVNGRSFFAGWKL